MGLFRPRDLWPSLKCFVDQPFQDGVEVGCAVGEYKVAASLESEVESSACFKESALLHHLVNRRDLGAETELTTVNTADACRRSRRGSLGAVQDVAESNAIGFESCRLCIRQVVTNDVQVALIDADKFHKVVQVTIKGDR